MFTVTLTPTHAQTHARAHTYTVKDSHARTHTHTHTHTPLRVTVSFPMPALSSHFSFDVIGIGGNCPADGTRLKYCGRWYKAKVLWEMVQG